MALSDLDINEGRLFSTGVVLDPTGNSNYQLFSPKMTRSRSSEMALVSVSSSDKYPYCQDSIMHVDIDHPEMCAKTVPLTCVIAGRTIILDKQNWPHLLMAIIERLIADGNSNLATLDKIPMYGGKIFFLPQKPASGYSALLSNGKWVYLGYNPPIIVKIIRNLCQHCGVELKDVVITYSPKDRYACAFKQKSTQKVDVQKYPSLFAMPHTLIDSEMETVIIAILEKYFPNGIRPDSIIDVNKFKKHYNDATGKDIPPAVKNIHAVLETIGIRHDKKVYAVPSGGKQELADMLDGLIKEGNRIIYYDELYNVNAAFLQGIHIFSSELLGTVLQSVFPGIYYYKHYCVTDRSVSVESEVLRCYESAICLSHEQLKEKLPFIPLANIRQVLARNNEFVRVSPGVYTHISWIEVNDNDSRNAYAQVEEAVFKQGFASLASLDVSASLELNHNLSETSVRNGLFQIFLADRYEKHGSIVTLKGVPLNSANLLKNFCLSHDRLTLKNIKAFEKEINGRSSIQALSAACVAMVRVDKKNFVADRKISFDIDAIDNAVELFFNKNNDFIPIQSVTSFTSFPYIDGLSWNLFLLESFCRRFSKRFTLLSLLVNSRNVGTIVKKAAGIIDYTEVLAAAVATALSVKINEEEAGNYLVNNHYIAKKTSVISTIVERALLLREKGL
jgi:hypothetical protein